MQTLDKDFQRRPFQVGGTLKVDDPTYIQRRADGDLYEGLRRGDLCYVLTSRQMGKSSLLVRAKHRLAQAGSYCLALDLTSVGTEDITPTQWYKGICAQLWLGFDLGDYGEFQTWWAAQQGDGLLQKLVACVQQILQHYPQQPVLIFVDEIDSVLALPFPVDDFFALIRYTYNQRAVEPAFQRLTFALFGVATPSDLIRDRTRTPFNVGQAIALEGFSLAEAQPLAAALGLPAELAQAVLASLLQWTAGQPFLTQKLCYLVWQHSQGGLALEADGATAWVSELVRQRLIQNWEAQDDPEHLRTIRDRLLRADGQAGGRLGLYQRIVGSDQELESDPVLADDNPDQADLLLAGLVRRYQGQLVVKNAIYRKVFNPIWVAEQLAKLRPYSQSLQAWLASDRQDESRLLRGQALRSAQQWAQGKRLTAEDFEYLAASEALDRQLIEDALKLAMTQEAEAKLQQEQRVGRLQKLLLRVLSLALLITAGVGGLAFWQFRRAVLAQGQAQQETIRALAASSQARFTANQRLAALVDAIQAEAGLRRLTARLPVPADVLTASGFALRQAIYGAEERNQLLSHTDNVNGIAFAPDGQRLASVSADTTLKIWQADGQVLHTVDASDTELYAVAYDPRGAQIAVAGGGGHVSLWTVEGEPLHQLDGHQVAVWSVTYSADGDYLLTASQDGTVKRWSRDGQLLGTLTAHDAPIYGVAISNDGQHWATASTDGTAKVWDAQGNLLTTLTGHQGPVWAVDFAPDGRWLVTAGDDQTLKLWQPDGTLLHSLTGHSGPIWGVRVSPDGDFLASTSVDQSVKLWRPNGTLIKTLRGHTGNVWGVDILAEDDAATVATASWDNSVRLWQPSNPLVQRLTTGDDYITQAVFDPTGDRIVSASLSGHIRLWSRQGDLIRTLGRHEVEAWTVAVSPDGSYIVSGSADNTLKIWSREGQLLHALTGHPDAVYGADISPDGTLIASTSLDGTLKIWSRDGALLHTRQVGQSSTTFPRFSPDGTRLATAGQNSLRLWTVVGDRLEPWRTLEVGRVNSLTFSPDGQAIATVNNELLRVWSLDGEPLHTITPTAQDADFLGATAFSPDGKQLAAIAWRQGLEVWQIKLIDLASGEQIAMLPGHQGRVRDLSFSSDGTQLLTGSFDQTIALWNLQEALTVDYLTFACQWVNDYLTSQTDLTTSTLALCQDLDASD